MCGAASLLLPSLVMWLLSSWRGVVVACMALERRCGGGGPERQDAAVPLSLPRTRSVKTSTLNIHFIKGTVSDLFRIRAVWRQIENTVPMSVVMFHRRCRSFGTDPIDDGRRVHGSLYVLQQEYTSVFVRPQS